MALRGLGLGVIRTHILHRASRAPIYDPLMAEELTRHAYSVSYGTLFPALHRMKEEGLLVREERLERGRIRKYYVATEKGLQELELARQMIRQLHQEVVEGVGPDPG